MSSRIPLDVVGRSFHQGFLLPFSVAATPQHRNIMFNLTMLIIYILNKFQHFHQRNISLYSLKVFENISLYGKTYTV